MTEIIVTVGPASINPDTLLQLKASGATGFRINLSHANSSSLSQYFSCIKEQNIIPAIDTQGAQLRVIDLPDSTTFHKGDSLNICFGQPPANINHSEQCPCIVLNHPEVTDPAVAGTR